VPRREGENVRRCRRDVGLIREEAMSMARFDSRAAGVAVAVARVAAMALLATVF